MNAIDLPSDDAVNAKTISSPSFFVLPLEVRNQVYHYYFLGWTTIGRYHIEETGFQSTQWRISPETRLDLAMVSRQIYRETQPFLDRIPSTLQLRVDCEVMQHYLDFLSFCPSVLRPRIASICLCVGERASIEPKKLSSASLNLFPQLRKLRLIYEKAVRLIVNYKDLYSNDYWLIHDWYGQWSPRIFLHARQQILTKNMGHSSRWSELFFEMEHLDISVVSQLKILWTDSSKVEAAQETWGPSSLYAVKLEPLGMGRISYAIGKRIVHLDELLPDTLRAVLEAETDLVTESEEEEWC